mgnify:CR=1 FL=1
MKFIDFFAGIGGFRSGLEKADLWTFGFPCQDVSIAGKQKGLKKRNSKRIIL